MQPEEKESTEYDGIYFLPGQEDDEMVLSYFDFKNEMADGQPIEGTKIGHKYHIAFFKKDEEGNPVFDDAFEAILSDPEVYLKNLTGAGVFGCVIRKTEKSSKWFEDYLKKVFGHITIKKMMFALHSIAESK